MPRTQGSVGAAMSTIPGVIPNLSRDPCFGGHKCPPYGQKKARNAGFSKLDRANLCDCDQPSFSLIRAALPSRPRR